MLLLRSNELQLVLRISPVSSKVSPVFHNSSAKFIFFFCSIPCKVREEMAKISTQKTEVQSIPIHCKQFCGKGASDSIISKQNSILKDLREVKLITMLISKEFFSKHRYITS